MVSIDSPIPDFDFPLSLDELQTALLLIEFAWRKACAEFPDGTFQITMPFEKGVLTDLQVTATPPPSAERP
jgi:hypothetical protein